MPKTRKDFQPETPPWLIEDWFPLGHRCMDTAPEGSFKTILGCWIAVCIASGTPVFGQSVYQGNVLLVDEETPETSLTYHLERFSIGLGTKYKELPIYKYCMKGFRFGRKTELSKLLETVLKIEPVFIRMDSLLAMLPSGRQAVSENDCHLGETVRDSLNELLSPHCTILLAAHSKKYIAELPLFELADMAMQTIVRGHGSIVGEGCDTGIVLKKISTNPLPTRFCIITKPRRQAIPFNTIRYIEMKEQRYGEGWARLEEISPDILPPSELAKTLYPIFEVRDKKGSLNHSSQWISRTYAFLTRNECKLGIRELLERRVIIERSPQNYCKNPNMFTECSIDYLEDLIKPK